MGRVRLLLHSDDATYDETTKKYNFTLDKRIDRPSELQVQKAHYSNLVGATHPLVVYLRSDSLSSLIKTKHTLRVKNDNHEQTQNIIATLSETHTTGRYDLQNDTRRFPTDPHRILRDIDIMFSDNETLLVKSGASGAALNSGNDTDIEAIGTDLLWWWDFDPNRVLSSAFQPVSTVGDKIQYYYNRSPAPQTVLLVTGYGAGLQLANIGLDGAKGATRSGSWESILDSTQPNPQFAQEYAYHTLVTMPSAIGTTSYILDVPGLKVYTSAGTINFRNVTDSGTATNMSYIPLRSYVLSIQRRIGTVDHDGNGLIDPYELVWRLEDLASSTVQTDLTIASWNFTSTAPSQLRIGKSNYHFDHVQGAIVAYNGTNSVHWDSAVSWLKAQYAGEVLEAGESTPAADSQWFVELDVVTEGK